MDATSRLERFKKFQAKRKQASNENFKDVLEENERLKRPVDWEKKEERIKQQIKKLEQKQSSEERGDKYDQQSLLTTQADDAQRWDRLRASKKRTPNTGDLDYEDLARIQHERLVKQMKPDMEEYQKTKKLVGEDVFYLRPHKTEAQPTLLESTPSTSNNDDLPIISPKHLYIDSKEGVERMIKDVEKQIETKKKRNRRRRFDHEADVDYINERNMRFNKKLGRAYDAYTAETRANLERGTSL